MDIAVLGPLEVDGTSTGFLPRDGVVLEALATHPGKVLSPEILAEAMWGDAVPKSWRKLVQGCIVRLRKLLGPGAIETLNTGYRLHIHVDDLDHQRFERLVGKAREHLAQGEPERTAFLVTEALALWRGPPLTGVEEWAPAQAEAERLQELRLEAEDLQTEAALRTGHHRRILGAAMTRVSEAPLRERRWALLALAQYQGGRQGDALLTLRRARTMLVQELGLDPGRELLDLEQAILRQDPALVAQVALPDASAICPYLGLMPYDVDDADAYFGRDADVAACLARLDVTRVLAVVGPSGCGKSSLVRAGVAAALRRDGREVAIITPGNRPLDALTAVRSAKAVLVVDQCEEALGADVDPRAQAGFFAALVEHTHRGILVLALRADRLGALSAHPSLARIVERELYLLSAMDADSLRSAIEGPARQAGLRVEPGLVDLLVREVEGEPGALPLLSHVLRQTWERREGNTLTAQGYRESGGVREAVARSAEELYERVPAAQRPALRDLLLRLVSPDREGEPVSNRVPRRQIATDEQREQLIEQLVGARLVSADQDAVELAHESLARTWPRLRAWLDDDVEGLRILRHLSMAADGWETMGRPGGELYRGARLAKALEWRNTAHPGLTDTERDFLVASEQTAEMERATAQRQALRERRSTRRLRALLGGVAALLIVGLVAGVVALRSRDLAESQGLAADVRRAGALALASTEADTSLLLAVAGVRLDEKSADAPANVLGALSRFPGLVRTVRTGPADNLAVDPVTGSVTVIPVEGGGLFFDGPSLRAAGRNDALPASCPKCPGPADWSLSISPDGQMLEGMKLATSQQEHSQQLPIQLFDVHAARPPVQLGGVPSDLTGGGTATFSPNGRWLSVLLEPVSGGSGQVVGVWDTRTPGSHPTALLHPGPDVWKSVVSSDGRTLYAGEPGVVEVIDVARDQVRATIAGPRAGVGPLTEQMRISPDGKTLALGAGSEIALVETASLAPKARLTAQGALAQVAFSADGRRLAAVDSGLVVWDITQANPTQLYRGNRWGAEHIELSPDGQTLYSFGQNSVQSWDVEGNAGFLAALSSPPTSSTDIGQDARFSPDGRRVAYTYYRGPGFGIEVRDVQSGRLAPLIKNDQEFGGYEDMDWRPDGLALTTIVGDPTARTWDVRTGKLIGARYVGPAARTASVEYTTDGFLLVGTDEGSLHVLIPPSLQPRGSPIKILDEEIIGLDANPKDHTVFVRGTSTRLLVDYLTGTSQRVTDLAGKFSPDGQRLAVLDASGAVGLKRADTLSWIAKPDPSRPLGGHSLAFSRNGAWLASSTNGKVGLWDGRTGAFAGSAELEGPVAVGFSEDSSTMVIASTDGAAVKTWDLRTESWVNAACRAAGRSLTAAEWQSSFPDRPYQDVCPSTS